MFLFLFPLCVCVFMCVCVCVMYTYTLTPTGGPLRDWVCAHRQPRVEAAARLGRAAMGTSVAPPCPAHASPADPGGAVCGRIGWLASTGATGTSERKRCTCLIYYKPSDCIPKPVFTQSPTCLPSSQEYIHTRLCPIGTSARTWQADVHQACASPILPNLLASVAALYSLLLAEHESPPSLPALLLHHLPLVDEAEVLELLDALRPSSMELHDWRAAADAVVITASVLEHDAFTYCVRQAATRAMGGGVVVVGEGLAGSVLRGGLAPFVVPYQTATNVPAALALLASHPHTTLLSRPTDELTRAVVCCLLGEHCTQHVF